MSRRVVLDPERKMFVDAVTAEPWTGQGKLKIGDQLSAWPVEIVGGRLLLWCGWWEPGEPDPSRWGQAGWDRFEDDVRAASDEAERRGVELWILPSAHGMLSDAIGTASWARRTGSTGVRLLVDPVGWLTDSMMVNAEDHLKRISELMIGCPLVGGVLLRAGGLVDPAGSVRAMRGLIDSAGVLVALDESEFALLDRA
ncbi:MAG: hypothetical protein KC996_05425 [Phycisphaerales bacterium]|nr:hypothetical protein [Phycisphaerales bacterium]